jgi:alpha-D-xyloside xylohydrolase
VEAPIETLPLFVRAGSILPLGAPVASTNETQKLAAVRVFSGANGAFTLYSDDGKTYGYERGDASITHLHWDDAARRLTGADADIVEIVGK